MAPIVRILLRYLAGFLIKKGILGANDQGMLNDPELVQSICCALAALCAAISEGWWLLARKYGWAK